MESELVSGFMTEHAAVIFVFFFLAEYGSILLICTLLALLFIGGYLLDLTIVIFVIISCIDFIIDLICIIFTVIEIDFNFLLDLYHNPFTLNPKTSTLDFYHISYQDSVYGEYNTFVPETALVYSIFSYLLQGIFYGMVLGLKAIFMMFVFIWARASFPRIRFDQLMSLCWTILLPIVIGFIILLPCSVSGSDSIVSNFSLLFLPFLPFHRLRLKTFNKICDFFEWSLSSPLKPHSFTSLPLQSFFFSAKLLSPDKKTSKEVKEKWSDYVLRERFKIFDKSTAVRSNKNAVEKEVKELRAEYKVHNDKHSIAQDYSDSETEDKELEIMLPIHEELQKKKEELRGLEKEHKNLTEHLENVTKQPKKYLDPFYLKNGYWDYSKSGNHKQYNGDYSTGASNSERSDVNSMIFNLETVKENSNAITDGYTPFLLPENNYILDFLLKGFFSVVCVIALPVFNTTNSTIISFIVSPYFSLVIVTIFMLLPSLLTIYFTLCRKIQ